MSSTSKRSIAPFSVAVCFVAYSQNYVINTVAGGGLPDNLPASTGLGSVQALAVDQAANVFNALPNLVLEIAAGTAVLNRVAGTGTQGFSGDNGPATSAQMGFFEGTGIAVDSSGSLYISDFVNNRIRTVSHGLITTIAGTGTQGFSGDNGPAISAQLCNPLGLAVDSSGSVYVSDLCNDRIRRIA